MSDYEWFIGLDDKMYRLVQQIIRALIATGMSGTRALNIARTMFENR